MSASAFQLVEQGLQFARSRADVLASDVANARTPGFAAADLSPELQRTEAGLRFAAVARRVDAAGATGLLEFAMAAQTQNAVRYRALADQERAMLREFHTVADEARRS